MGQDHHLWYLYVKEAFSRVPFSKEFGDNGSLKKLLSFLQLWLKKLVISSSQTGSMQQNHKMIVSLPLIATGTDNSMSFQFKAREPSGFLWRQNVYFSTHAVMLESFAANGHLTSGTPVPQYLHSIKECGVAPKHAFLMFSTNPAGIIFSSSYSCAIFTL